MIFPKAILVCTSGKRCRKRGSKDVYAALVAEADKDGKRIEVSKCDCQKLCKSGPTVVVPDDDVAYGSVKTSDAAEIIAAHSGASGDKCVERLRVERKKRKHKHHKHKHGKKKKH